MKQNLKHVAATQGCSRPSIDVSRDRRTESPGKKLSLAIVDQDAAFLKALLLRLHRLRDVRCVERRNPIFTLGRLSRPDPKKYPLDFPVFYEEMGLKDARYRVMAWSKELDKQYRWHRFGPEWELLSENKEPALKFLNTLDVFLYPLGHRIKESWGRAVVEAMLTGCVPVVPNGHQFHKLMVPGESGFICQEFSQWKEVVRELCENYPFRMKIGKQCAEHARGHLCNPETHRRVWIEALSL